MFQHLLFVWLEALRVVSGINLRGNYLAMVGK